MARDLPGVVHSGTLLQICVAAIACPLLFGEDQATIVPRARPPIAGSLDARSTAIRVDSALVLIPVHVTTTLGATVTDLGKDNFELFEDNVRQTIALVANDDAPMSIGLLFDASGSMKNKRQKVTEAAAAFLKTANKDDEFFLVEFNERVKLVMPFTPDVQDVYSRIAHTRPFGQTALFDAFHLALREMKNARNLRKALVVISDGGDNWSRHTARQVSNELLEGDVQVYAIGIFDGPDRTAHQMPEEREGPSILEDLAGQTGGRLYPANNIDDLPAIATKISRELRTQYLLGYSPQHPTRDGKYRRVQVKLTVPSGMPELRVYYRLGYYGTSQ